jgi:hypothetical protein
MSHLRRITAGRRQDSCGCTRQARVPCVEIQLAHTAVSVNPSGYAITTPVAGNPLDQGNGVVIFARVRGRWRAVADGSSFTHVSGMPAAVLAALLHVPHEGSV